MDKFYFYEGCNSIEESIINIEYLGLLKHKCYFIRFLGQYYAVFYHSSSRVVIIGKEKVFYTRNGRMVESNLEDAFIDFDIDKRDKNKITNTLAQELNMIDETLEVLYFANVNSKVVKAPKDDMRLSKYVVILGVTFASEFYTFNNLHEINKYFTLRSELKSFLLRTKGAVAINPFTQELEFADGSIKAYKITYYTDFNYNSIAKFALIEDNEFADDGVRHWMSIARYQEKYPDDFIMYEQPDFRVDKDTCKWCGGALPEGRVNYCSEECRNEFYRAIKVNNKSVLPYKIMCRDKFICKECGKDLALVNQYGMKLPTAKYKIKMDSDGKYRIDAEVHHKVEVKDGGEDISTNLDTLCWDCHKKKHSAKKVDNAIYLFKK